MEEAGSSNLPEPTQIKKNTRDSQGVYIRANSPRCGQ
jgi:hypothetical protein